MDSQKEFSLRQAVLLGNPGTKRTDYFEQAAAFAKLPVLFVNWSGLDAWMQQAGGREWFLKIDPPLWQSCCLGELENLAESYRKQLDTLAHAAGKYQITFFNHPDSIKQLLDKRACKKKLQKAGLAVTQLLEKAVSQEPAAGWMQDKNQESCGQQETGTGKSESMQKLHTAGELLELMQESGVYQVFLKPVYGSGAAGVSALRWHPAKNRMVLYTCALEHPKHGLVNTKKLRCFTGRDEIMSLLESILQMDCVAERWHAKAQHQGYSYDLRAVVLDGSVEFLLGRLSRGPVTNLHLNNHPLSADELQIPPAVRAQIEELCARAAGCYPGLRCAGIDILLERGSLQPRIIEMNAQGDLIYQDIFHENRIYRRQAQIMAEWIKRA